MNVVDRWHKTEKLPNGSKRRVKSKEYGIGLRWQVRWRDYEGKPKKQNFEHFKDAESFAAKIKHELDTLSYVDPNKGKILFAEYSMEWLARCICEPSSVANYERALRLHINPVIGRYSLIQLSNTPSLIQSWISGCKGKASSIRNYRDTASFVFRSAIHDGYINKNPCLAGITLPSTDRELIVPFTDEEAYVLVNLLGAIVVVGISVGLRQGELFGLSPDDIDWRNNIVRVRRQVKVYKNQLMFGLPKGRRERDVPMPLYARESLLGLMESTPPVDVTLPWSRPSGALRTVPLFFTHEGRAHRRSSYNTHVWQPAIKAAGISDVRDRKSGMHRLRHTYASILLANQVDIKTLSVFMGHHDPGFTLRTYTHLLPNSAEKVRSAIDGLLKIRAPTGHSD